MDKAALISALEATLLAIDGQMTVLMDEARRMNVGPYLMQNRDGTFAMVPILSARATVLAALTSLLDSTI